MNKMKTKRKLVLSFSLIFIALFVVSITTNAATNYTVEYPTHVELGATITVNLVFNYATASDCIYDMKVYFYWSINNDVHTTCWTDGVSKYISNYPRPANISWTFNTSAMAGGTLQTNDTIQFRFMYKMGIEDAVTNCISFLGIIITDTYEIAIREPKGVSGFEFALITIAVIFTRKRRKVGPYA